MAEDTRSLEVSHRRFLTWRLGILICILVLVGAWVFGVPRWLQTQPQYSGEVSVTEMKDHSMLQQECGNAISFSQSLDCSPTNISAQTSDAILSSQIISKPELQYPHTVYGDNHGSVYVLVENRPQETFTTEICKVYKVESDQLLQVGHLPTELYCNALYTDFKGTWLVRGMTHDGGATSDVYVINGTRGLYVPEFHTIPITQFFYDSRNGGSLYSVDNYSSSFYKVSFTLPS